MRIEESTGPWSRRLTTCRHLAPSGAQNQLGPGRNRFFQASGIVRGPAGTAEARTQARVPHQLAQRPAELLLVAVGDQQAVDPMCHHGSRPDRAGGRDHRKSCGHGLGQGIGMALVAGGQREDPGLLQPRPGRGALAGQLDPVGNPALDSQRLETRTFRAVAPDDQSPARTSRGIGGKGADEQVEALQRHEAPDADNDRLVVCLKAGGQLNRVRGDDRTIATWPRQSRDHGPTLNDDLCRQRVGEPPQKAPHRRQRLSPRVAALRDQHRHAESTRRQHGQHVGGREKRQDDIGPADTHRMAQLHQAARIVAQRTDQISRRRIQLERLLGHCRMQREIG